VRVVRAVQARGLLAVVAALGVLAALVEVFAFNLPHWLSLAAPAEIAVTADNATLSNVEWDAEAGVFRMTGAHGRVTLDGLDAVVKTVWIDPVFDQPKTRQAMKVRWGDESSSERDSGSFDLVEGAVRQQYVVPSAMGHVTSVVVEFDADTSIVTIRQIVLNATIPLFFSWVRWLALWAAAVGLYYVLHGGLWRHPLNPASRRQRVVNGCLVGAGIAALVTVVMWTVPVAGFSQTLANLFAAENHQYAKLADAFLQGQVSLLDQPDQSLLDAERPYDPTYRWQNGVNFQMDYAFYNGKYYSYFGIVPFLLLYLPVRAITGQQVSTAVATILFGAAATAFLYLVWRETVRRWFPKLPYVLYALGTVALFACSQLLFVAARPSQLESIEAAGLMCVTFGAWSLLKATATRHLRLPWLAAAAAGLALAVGCRPNLVLLSALLPVLVWPRLPRVKPAARALGAATSPTSARPPLDWGALWRPALAVAVPYLVVAAGLMTYNAVRFGSVVEFGASYQLTVSSVAGYMHRGIFGSLVTAAYGVLGYFCATLYANQLFPHFVADWPDLSGYLGYVYTGRTLGLAWLPLAWTLPFIPALGVGFKARHPLRPFVLTLLAVAVAEAGLIGVLGGILGRYQADFAWLVALAGLVTLLLLYERGLRGRLNNGALIAVCAAVLVLTAVIAAEVGVMGESEAFLNVNPDLFYRVQNLTRFW
jgi:hypothetical protein